MWNTRQAVFFAPLLLATTMGSTNCEYYRDVVVPAADSSPPTAWDGVWRDGEYKMLRSSGGSGLTYHLHPDQGVIAVSSGLDPEGLRKITMSVEESWTCCNGNICSSAAPLWSPIVETQAGSVGSTVSTGIWTGLFVDLPTCNTGYTLTSYRFAWTTKAENFHGGQVTSATHRILYP